MALNNLTGVFSYTNTQGDVEQRQRMMSSPSHPPNNIVVSESHLDAHTLHNRGLISDITGSTDQRIEILLGEKKKMLN